MESQMYRSRLPDGNWEPVKLEGLKSIASYDVSPDGSELLLMGRGQIQEPVRPYRVPVEGGAVKLLPFGGGSNIAWARKGDMLAFVTAVRCSRCTAFRSRSQRARCSRNAGFRAGPRRIAGSFA